MGLEKLPSPLSFVIMYGTLCNCNELSNQYSSSHEAYEIQVTSLTRSLAQMEEQLRLANEDRVSGFQDISLFMATDLTFRFSLYNRRFGGPYLDSFPWFVYPKSGSASDPGFWSRVTTLLLQLCVLGKFHVIEGQDARDQISSDRWYKHAHDQI